MAASDMSDLDRCKRYLKFALDGQSYKTLGTCCTAEKCQFVNRLIEESKGKDILNEIETLFDSGNYVQIDVLIFVTAMCSKSTNLEQKQEAYNLFKKMCSTPRQMFTFLQSAHTLRGTTRGWGRSLRRALSEWYHERPLMELAEGVTKEKTFKGWSHLDVLRLGHMKASNEDTGLIFKFLAKGLDEAKKEYEKDGIAIKDEHKDVLNYLTAVKSVKHSSDIDQIAKLVKNHKLCIEHVPTCHLRNKEVWIALLSHITLVEALSHLGTLAEIGLLDPQSKDSKHFLNMLKDNTVIKSSKLKPLQVLNAISVYENGRSNKPPTWTKHPEVLKAFNHAFDISVKNTIVPTKKRFLLAVDLDSVLNKSTVRGSNTMSNVIAAAGISLAVFKAEPKVDVIFLCNGAQPLSLKKSSSLNDVLNDIGLHLAKASVMKMELMDKPTEELAGVPLPTFNPSLAIKYALQKKKKVDVFVFMSDARGRGPMGTQEQLLDYRRKMDLPHAGLLSCGFTCSEIIAADPNDKGMLNICGYNDKVLDVINMFASCCE